MMIVGESNALNLGKSVESKYPVLKAYNNPSRDIRMIVLFTGPKTGMLLLSTLSGETRLYKMQDDWRESDFREMTYDEYVLLRNEEDDRPKKENSYGNRITSQS